jgi:bifunctional non-homologous end joining protein LigD
MFICCSLKSLASKSLRFSCERTRPGLGDNRTVFAVTREDSAERSGWLHEIKHDGFRILARRDSAGLRLITRAGNDFSSRFPFIAVAVGKLPVRSCLIDGEAIVCDENGLADFELIRRHGSLASAALCALELDGRDLRREPLEQRRALLAKLLRGSKLSIVLNEHYEEDGAIVFRDACRLGCEGIVSKWLGSPYWSGRVPHWVKVKNLKGAGSQTRGRGRLGVTPTNRMDTDRLICFRSPGECLPCGAFSSSLRMGRFVPTRSAS